MRKLLFYSILCCLQASFAQEYVPLLNNLNEWHHSFNTSSDLWTDIYYTDGDTLVNNKNYYILDGYHYISRTFLLREDVPEKKVYLKILNNGSVGDYLLYDFSMEVGDSIDMKNPITPFPEDAGYFTLNAIELAPLVDGNVYRHYYLSPSVSNTVSTNDAIWVEGVGSLSIITAPSGEPDVNAVGIVRCAFKDGTLFYSDGHFSEPCEAVVTLGIDEQNNPLSELLLISNPSEQAYQLIHAQKIQRLDIFNLQGVLMKSMTQLGASRISLEVSEFPAGLYLIDARNSSNHKKILKFVVK